MTNSGILRSCSYLCVGVEDFDPLHRHEQIHFSGGGSFSVRALRSQAARKAQKQK